MNDVQAKDISFEKMIQQWETIPSVFSTKMFKARMRIGKMYVKKFKHSFETKRSPKGDVWPLRKNEEGYTHPLMVETGDLKNSITYELVAGGDIVIYTDEAKFINSNRRPHGSKSYAAFHNEPIGHNKPRRFIEDSKDLEIEVKQMINKILDKLL